MPQLGDVFAFGGEGADGDAIDAGFGDRAHRCQADSARRFEYRPAGDAFDRTRPLWQFVVVEGLRGGKAALVEKLHHTIVDGEAGVQLSLQFLDFSRDAVSSQSGRLEVICAA